MVSNFLRGVLHVGAVAFQVANLALPFIPPPYNVAAAAAVGLIQAIVDLRKKPAPQGAPK